MPIQGEQPYWEEEKEGDFSHSVGVFQLHASILETFKMQNLTEEGKYRDDSTVSADSGQAEGNKDSDQEACSTIQSGISPSPSSKKSSYSQSWWPEEEDVCRLQKLTELDIE